jgi:hypothetical protein
MGDMADMAYDNAFNLYLDSLMESESMSDEDLVDNLKWLMSPDKDGYKYPYESDKWTTLVESILQYYEKYGKISEKQRLVLINHYAQHNYE